MSFAILGLGTALPPNRVTQAEAAEVARRICCHNDEHAELLPVLYRQSGIQTRHMVFRQEVVEEVLSGNVTTETAFVPESGDHHGPSTDVRMRRYREEALPLALEAARQALNESGVESETITHIVTVSCTGFSAPGVDVGLMKGLELAPTVQRTHVGFMGCHGAINGLRVARALADAEPDARVLLCAVELCSLHFHYGWDPKKVVANALFADGAAAVVGANDRSGSADWATCWRMTAAGSCLFPDSEHAMTWNIGDHGFEMTLSTKVPALIGKHLRPWLEEWLQKHGVRLDQVRSWAIHPGGPRILNAVEEPLGIDKSLTAVSRDVLAECGNMSSPTAIFILDRLRRQGAPRPCVGLGFGPGLVAEALLLE